MTPSFWAEEVPDDRSMAHVVVCMLLHACKKVSYLLDSPGL